MSGSSNTGGLGWALDWVHSLSNMQAIRELLLSLFRE